VPTTDTDGLNASDNLGNRTAFIFHVPSQLHFVREDLPVNDGGDQRRLSAILAADVVGYTRLMEQDTDGTVAAWKSARTNIIDPTISEYSGQIVKHTGDGFLAEFHTVQDAVNCAVALQVTLASNPLGFRMGINLGDIIDDGEDIHGEGVNIAARLEALAEPGGICLSQGVYDQVINRVDYSFIDMGEHTVKHVSKPLKVLRIDLGGSTAPTVETSQLTEPDKPSIIVLPFKNMTGDDDKDYLADGLRLDIQNALVKVSGVFLIAFGSASAQQGKSPHNATSSMGVRFALEGSIRRAGDTLRISTTLTDGITGEIVWTEKFDRQMGDAFALLDEITEQVLTAINVKLVAGEPAKVWHKTLKDLRSLEALYRGIHAFLRMDSASLVEALRHFELISKLHPDASVGPTWAALTHWYNFQRDWNNSRDESIRLARQWAEKSVALPDCDGQAQTVLCHLHLLDQNFDAALTAGKSAISNRPNCTHANGYYANVLHYCGDQDAALRHIRLAIRYSPIHPSLFTNILSNIYRARGDCELATLTAKSAIATTPDDLMARLVLASLATRKKQSETAASLTEEILRIEPTFTVSRFAAGQPYRSEEFLAELVAELREAGLPE
jgi:adenylate cyclase